MKPINGVPAVRMAALMFANHGKTMEELIAFVSEQYPGSSRREIAIEAWRAGIRQRDYKLALPKNVTPIWRDLPAWKVLTESKSEGSAA
jgi:hypothetical protein